MKYAATGGDWRSSCLLLFKEGGGGLTLERSRKKETPQALRGLRRSDHESVAAKEVGSDLCVTLAPARPPADTFTNNTKALGTSN